MPIRNDIKAVQGGYKIYLLNTGRDLTDAVAVRMGYKWLVNGAYTQGYWTEADGVVKQGSAVRYKHTNLPKASIAVWPEADFGLGFENISPDPLIYNVRAKGSIP